MPKGKKVCQKCNAQHGPRTQKCDCGFEFLKIKTVPLEQKKTVPLEQKKTVPEFDAKTMPEPVYVSISGRIIYTPAGFCPVKPVGFKNDKWEEPWTEDSVSNWAINVYNYGPAYLPEAVIYFARYFWDINGPDFKKIRNLILEALIPKKVTNFIESK